MWFPQTSPGISVVGAVCPESGESVGLLSPAINGDVVNIFLNQFTEAVSRDVHVLLLWDQSGFHMSKKLKIPENMTIVPFNLKFNKKLTNLHGRVNIAIHQGVQVYQIKTTAVQAFVINPETNEAIFVRKANLIDTTGPDNPVSIAGNLTLLVSSTDSEDSEKPDSIGITLWNGNELWFSSIWTGTETIEQYLAAGNLVVRR